MPILNIYRKKVNKIRYYNSTRSIMRPDNCGIMEFYEKNCLKCDYAKKCPVKSMIENEKNFYTKHTEKQTIKT